MRSVYGKRRGLWRVLAVAAAVCMVGALAMAETNLALFDFEGDIGAWGGATLTSDNVHGGRRAMVWRVATRPGFNSPSFDLDLTEFTELRFWAYAEEDSNFYIPIVLPCEGGYWIAPFRVNWTGWKEHRIPLKKFNPARKNIDFTGIRSIGFRAQGYGQDEVPKDLTLVLDDFSFYSPKDLGISSMADLIREARRKRLAEYKAQGNPYYAKVVDDLKNVPAKPNLKMDFDSAWKFRSLAENAYASAWAATAEESPRKGDAALVSYSITHIDFILANHKEGSWKYSRNWPGGGDANTDRFTLGPTMYAIYYLRQLPDMEQHWERWKAPLKEAVDFQYKYWATHKERNIEGNKGWGQSAYEYPNQDVYNLVEMEFAHRWYGEQGYRDSVEKTIAGLQEHMLPDGGWHYIGPETECPVYHQLNLVWLAHYLKLTGDERVRKMIADSVEYYPLVMTNEGYPESYSDCWWKHNWGNGSSIGPDIVAGITGDGRNKWLANRLMEQGRIGDKIWAVSGGLFYRDDIEEKPLPDNWVVLDRNIDGPRGRFGKFYWAGTVGGGARDTFAGCLMSSPDGGDSLKGALMAANVHVLVGNSGNYRNDRLYVSGPDDRTAVYVGERVGALGARHTARKSYINSVVDRKVDPTPWQVTQVWVFTPTGIAGLVEVEATTPQECYGIHGELRMGPRRPVVEEGKGQYLCGELAVRILGHNYPDLKLNREAGHWRFADRKYAAIQPTTPVGSDYRAKPGAPLWYAAALGPEGFKVDGFERLRGDKDYGIRVQIGGQAYEVRFDPASEAIVVR